MPPLKELAAELSCDADTQLVVDTAASLVLIHDDMRSVIMQAEWSLIGAQKVYGWCGLGDGLFLVHADVFFFAGALRLTWCSFYHSSASTLRSLTRTWRCSQMPLKS